MRVFISWSGERSRHLASAFREWLPLVLHYVEPWLSEADIEAGERWAQSVANELAASNFGIVCVTSENLNSPWVLFEAGALAKSLETSRVVPVLFDLDLADVSGPLAQFQAKKVVRSGIGEIIQSLQAAADKPIPEERARQLFDALWPQLECKLNEVPDRPPTERSIRPQHEVLEELVASVRALDGRIRESEELIVSLRTGKRGSRYNRVPPMMIHEMSRFVGEDPDDPIGMLVMCSVFRDDAPWLYEIALDAYRAVSQRRRGAQDQVRRLVHAVDMTLHSPFPSEEWGLDPRALDMVMHELFRYLDMYSDRGARGSTGNDNEPEKP